MSHWIKLLLLITGVCGNLTKPLSADPPLIRAIDSGNVAQVRKLLAQGANPNFRTADGATALIDASATGSDEVGNTRVFAVIPLLLSHGAHINAQDYLGESALMVASNWDSPDALQYLLEKHAKVDLRDNEGKTALMFACESDGEGTASYPECVHLLLKYGAQVNLRDHQGNTALLWDAQNDEYTDRAATQSAADLIRHGALIRVRNKAGKTPLQYARENHLRRLVKLLDKYSYER